MNIYLELTKNFNLGKLRAIITSGQAVVLHRLAIMSKDGDWILREDGETTDYILKVLSNFGAKYRFGAPLDCRWLSGGWSAHFQFEHNSLRIRTDFFTRPPRIHGDELKRLWQEQNDNEIPFVDSRILAEVKKTNREKDYVVIGELARIMDKVENQFLYSRSARDLIHLASQYPQIVSNMKSKRSILNVIPNGLRELEKALDEERRELIHANEDRLNLYAKAYEKWYEIWPELQKKIGSLSLSDGHEILVEEATQHLPKKPEGIEFDG